MSNFKRSNNRGQLYYQNSSKFVEQFLSRDEKRPDLHELLSQPSTTQSSEIMVRKQFAILPEALFEQYNKLEYKCFMGLFPEINRAWVTIDNKFFIWNYLDGSDFNEYDELDQVILSAGLVKPKPGIFKDYVKYLLVLATPVEVVLVACTFSEENEFSELALLTTNYSVSTDNVNMLKILGTTNGRIFMCGQDGCLYELVYEAEEGWFRSKCRKLNHSQNIFGYIIPSFLKFSSDNAIIDIIIDDARNILYTLSSKSTIEVYDLGDDGNEMSRVHTYQNLKKDAQRILPRVHWDQDTLRLMSIAPIEISESKIINIVGISSKGDRFYFSANTSRKGRPSKLTLSHIRQAPKISTRITSTLMTGINGNQGIKEVHEAFYRNGVFIMADSIREDIDNLISIAVEPTGQTFNQQTFSRPNYNESMSTIEVQGKTLALGEITTSLGAPFDAKQDENLSELAVQHRRPPREFVCLTNNGIHITLKLRPVDQLRKILRQLQPGMTETEDFKNFIKSYGDAEVCCMLLMLICSGQLRAEPKTQPGLNGTQLRNLYDETPTGTRDMYLLKIAEECFFRVGGEPQYDSITAQRAQQGMYDMTPLTPPDVIFSASHNGLYLYFSRLLRPVWKQPIFKSTKDQQDIVSIVSTKYTPAQLREIELPLLRLKEFFERNPYMYSTTTLSQPQKKNIMKRIFGEVGKDGTMHGGLVHKQHSEEAKRQQQLSLAGLYQLTVRCLQALALIEMLGEFNLKDMMEKYSKKRSTQKQIKQISRVTFRELILQAEGEDIIKKMVKLIVARGLSIPINQLCLNLKEKCSTFFTQNDLFEYEAYELLQRAKSEDGPDRERDLMDSLEKYKKIAAYVDANVICKEFQRLKFYQGAVELALTAAEQVDPSGLAIEWNKSGRPPQDVQAREAYDNRLSRYACALNVLDELFNPLAPEVSFPRITDFKSIPQLTKEERIQKLNQVLKRMLSSKDELFHETLYTWYIDKRLEKELLTLQTPYLENFLIKHKYLDLLWKYYEQNERYDKAAKILMQLAEKKDEKYKLIQRLEFLSKGIANARASTNMGELLNQLQEKLDVAQVQKRIKNELEQMYNQDPTNEELHQAIHELDISLMNVTQLYNQYAQKYKLESRLLILYVSEYKDEILIKKLWTEIIARAANQGPHELRFKITFYGRELYPSKIFFPIDFLCALLEKYNFDSKYPSLHFVINIMRETGVSFIQLYGAYKKIYNEMFGYNVEDRHIGNILPINDPDFKQHIFSVIVTILSDWVTYIKSASATIADKNEFPFDELTVDLDEFESRINQFDQNNDDVRSIRRKLQEIRKGLTEDKV